MKTRAGFKMMGHCAAEISTTLLINQTNKNSFKKNLFKSADAYFAFKKSMSNCVDYYIENIDNSGTDLNKMVQFIRNVYTSFLNQEVLHNDNRKDMPKTGFIAYKEEQNDTSNQCSEIEH